MEKPFFLPLFFLVALAICANAGPLKEAKVTKIINDVSLVDPAGGSHTAVLNDVVRDEIGLETGLKSRSELLFQDDTLTRIGPETYFSFRTGTREMSLNRGTLLLQVPKGLGGAKIHTAAITASITGTTILMEHVPNKHMKVLVLEGSLRLSAPGMLGDSVILHPGQMVIMPPSARTIPNPVTVDIKKIVQTSSLVNMPDSKNHIAALPSIALIDQEITNQQRDKSHTLLIPTNLVIDGHGTNVQMDSDSALAEMERHQDALLLASNTIGTSPNPTPSATPAATPTPTATASPTATVSPSATATPTASASPSATASPTATIAPSPTPGGSPIAATTPYPTPDTAATPPPAAGRTLHKPPPLNGAFTIRSSTTFKSNGSTPKITDTKTPGLLPGAIYGGSANDGPASYFLFGGSSSYDAQRHFDQNFGSNGEQAFPAFGVATYRFSALGIAGAPTFALIGGLPNMAFVSDGDISEPLGTTAYTWNIGALNSVTFASSGNISLSNATFDAAAGSALQFLQFYQRGATGAFSFGGNINTPTASLYIDAPANVSLAGSSTINVDKAVINSGQNVNFNGSFSANFLQVWGGSAIHFKKKPSPLGVFYGYAPTLTATSDLVVTGGDLQIGTGGIDVKGFNIAGFDNVITDGNLDAGDVSVKNRLYVGGLLQSSSVQPHTFTAFSIELPQGLQFVGAAGAAGGDITLLSDHLLIDSATGGINGVNLDGGDASLLNLAGGDGGTLNMGTDASPIANDVTINAPVTATTGANGLSLLTGGKGGTVNVVANGTVAVNSTIKVSDNVGSKKSSAGGNISIKSNKTSGTAISVNSSAQLLSLLDAAATGPGGTIKFTSAGGAINLSGKVQADRGTIDVRNNGASGAINIDNANLNASTVKANALGNNGTLSIGRSTISADTLISLYAGGSNGAINFTGNVTLSGNSVKNIAADTVTIFNGKTVTVLGPAPASVYTNNANYTGFGGNGTTSGTWAGQGATTLPLIAAPPGG